MKRDLGDVRKCDSWEDGWLRAEAYSGTACPSGGAWREKADLVL